MKCNIKKIVFPGIWLCLFVILTFTGCATKQTVSGSPSVTGAYSEMNSVEFWLTAEKNPDKPLMTPAEVKDFTVRIAETEGTDCIALDTYPETLDRDTLLQAIRLYSIPEENRYIGDKELDKAYYEALSKNRNEAGAQVQNPVRFGVVVQNSQLRTWPTTDVSYDLPNDIEFDLNCETILKTGERVAVLHTSQDGQWMLTQAYNYLGWVQRELTMGTRLPLVRKKPDTIDGISTVSSYVAKIPVHLANGELQMTDTGEPVYPRRGTARMQSWMSTSA